MASLHQLLPNSPLTLDNQGWTWLTMIGRLKPEVSPDQARANLQVILEQLLSARDTRAWSKQAYRLLLCAERRQKAATNKTVG